MRKLFFHTYMRTVAVPDTELDTIWWRAVEAVLAALHPELVGLRERLIPMLIGADCISRTPETSWYPAFSNWLRVARPRSGFRLDGEVVSCTDLALNTLSFSCSPATRFVAKLLAFHAELPFIEARDGEWLAEMIELALLEGLLREDAGWPDVIDLAKTVEGRESGPIVITCSIAPNFPNSEAARWKRSLSGTAPDWDELLPLRQWRQSVRGVRLREDNKRIWPRELDRPLGDGHTVENVLLVAGLNTPGSSDAASGD